MHDGFLFMNEMPSFIPVIHVQNNIHVQMNARLNDMQSFIHVIHTQNHMHVEYLVA